MEILILCGIYLVELLCYQLGLRILFEVRQKPVAKVWMAVGILLPVVIGCLPVEASGKNVLVTVSVILVMFLTLQGSSGEKGARLILTLILLICIEDIFQYFAKEILVFNSMYTISSNYLEVKCCTAFSTIMIMIAKMKFLKDRKTRINSGIYLVLGVIAISMMFCLATLNRVKIYLSSSRYILLCNVLNVAIHISIFLLLVFIIYIKNTHERMEQLLKTEQLLKELQVNYYKEALKKESDTRKYRHDMVNHLVYMQEILSENRTDETLRYLNNILGGFKRIQSTYYIIGNEMIDTIMNYFFGMLPKGIEIDIKEKCPVEIDIDDIEVCTIFSNLFQNAVEEILENNIVNAKIVIEVEKGKQYVQYNIKNTLSAEIDEKQLNKNGLPKSRKGDKQNHGIGILNAKEAIERNHGKFEWFQEEGYFCVKVVLPTR